MATAAFPTFPQDQLRFAIAPAVRFVRDDHGLVLFDMGSGCYSSLNSVGALVWSQIEAGASTSTIVERVRRTFADVDRDVVDHDVRAILRQLVREGLITAGGNGGVTAPRRSAPTNAGNPTADLASEPAGFWTTFKAFAFLVCVDLSMRLAPFGRVYDMVRKTPTRPREPGPQALARICRATDEAARFYFKRAWCLQRSAACVLMLRRDGGIPAELVLGVRTFPFEAHAWVELDGRVLNDELDHVGRFLVLDRI